MDHANSHMSGSPRTVMMPQQYHGHHSPYNGPPYPPYGTSRLPYPPKSSIVHHGQPPPPQPHEKSNSAQDHRVSMIKFSCVTFSDKMSFGSLFLKHLYNDFAIFSYNNVLDRVTCTSTRHPPCLWTTRGTTPLPPDSTPLIR